MQLDRKKLIWIIGGAIGVVIIGLISWSIWWSAVPYDTSDPEVQKQLTHIEAMREDISNEKNIINSYIQIGYVYEQLGDDRRALASYKKLAQIRPLSSPPFIAMGQFYRVRELPILSEKNLLKAIENDQDNPSIYQDLSFLYIYNSELTKGRQNFEALILDTTNEYTSIKANLFHTIAFYFKEIGNYQSAKNYFIQLLELAPERSSDWQTELDELNKL